MLSQTEKRVTKKVFGYHPNWAAKDSYKNYDYSVLTDIGYFSAQVDTATGEFANASSISTKDFVDFAHSTKTKAHLVITNFGNERNSVLLNDEAKKEKLMQTTVDYVQANGFDGVNIDFESVASSEKALFVKFIGNLRERLKAIKVDYQVSLAMPAVNWSNAYDLKKLDSIADFYVIMGYDYYYSGSPSAGPVAPLSGMNYSVLKSVDTYYSLTKNAEKILLGVPWYGYDWPVNDTAYMAKATGAATARTYSAAKVLAQTYGSKFDTKYSVPYVKYEADGNNRQMWYDDSLSLALKYQLINSKNLGGIGIWALSYNGDNDELYEGIYQTWPGEPSSSVSESSLSAIVSPNPVTDKVSLFLASDDQASEYEFAIYNSNGEEVSTVQIGGLDNQAIFDCSQLTSGVYYIRAVKSGKVCGASFVVRK